MISRGVRVGVGLPRVSARPSPVLLAGTALTILVFACTLALNLSLLPKEPALGLDFLLFYGTALAVRRGFSPYDAARRASILRHLPLLSRPHQHMVPGLYGNPPLFAWALAPLTSIPPLAAYAIWVAILAAATLGALWTLLRYYRIEGVGAKRGWLVLLFALSPVSMYAYFLGQLAPLMLLGVALALAALVRDHVHPGHSSGHTALAGVLLTVVWLKPHLLLPLCGVMALLLPRRGGVALLGGLLVGSASCAVLSIVLLGQGVLVAWARGLVAFGQSFGAQPGVSSLAGLYRPLLGGPWSTALSAVLCLLWVLYVGRLAIDARRRGLAPGDDGWLRALALALASWLLVVPYTHTPDLALVALALPSLLGRDLERWSDTRVRLAVAVLLIAPELDLAGGFALSPTMAYSVLVPVALLFALHPSGLPVQTQRASFDVAPAGTAKGFAGAGRQDAGGPSGYVPPHNNPSDKISGSPTTLGARPWRIPSYARTLALALRRRGAAILLWEGAALSALVALGLTLRVAHLRALPLFFDEAEYTRAAQVVGSGHGPATLLASLGYGAPPLFSWLAAPLTRFPLDPLLATRLASALIGAATLVAIWAIGRALAGATVALLAAALYALSPFALFYGRMAMLDGLVAACGAGALLFSVRLARDGRRGDALALGLCLAAGLLTKVFAASMLLLPLLAILAARPRERGRVRRGAILAALAGILPFVLLLLTPQGGGLLSAAHTHAQVSRPLLTVERDQLGVWGFALWLYVTPPVLALALLGLWAMRRERAARIVGPWALLGGLPPALVPGAFLAPRYFLYIAVPLVVLAARGTVVLAGLAQRAGRHAARVAAADAFARARGRRNAGTSVAVALLVAALASVPAAAADRAIIAAPDRAPLTPFDRWQYVDGWPSGYALDRVAAYLRARAARGPVMVYSSIYNPPGDALAVLLWRDPRFTLANVDFATLPAHPLRAAAYLVACRPYGQALRPDPRALRLVLRAANGDGVGGVDLYHVVAR